MQKRQCLHVRSIEHESRSDEQCHMAKPLHFQPDDVKGVLELDTAEDFGNNGYALIQNSLPVKSGGKVTWSGPIVTEPTHSRVTRLGQITTSPERLTYAPAVELQMAELNQVKLTTAYLFIWCMELALVGAGVGGGIKHTKELKVLNFKIALQSLNADEWCK